MWKKILSRAIISMAITCLVTQIFDLIAILIADNPDFVPLVPDYLAHFESPLLAVSVSILLTSVIGAVFGGASVLYDLEKWSFLKQGIVHFFVTSVVWIPISVYLWGLGKYPTTFISVFISFTVTYGVVWFMQYLKTRDAVRKINEKLVQLDQFEKGSEQL